MVLFDKEKLAEQLRALKELPQIKEVTALRHRLEKELERLSQTLVEEKIPKQVIEVTSNAKRSSKLSRYWRYVKLIHDSYPNLKLKEIRSQLKKRQQGQESDIPDAVWQNPSG